MRMMGLGHLQAWKNAEAARKRFPGATGFEFKYGPHGEVRKVTPRYETRGGGKRFSSWMDQQVAMQQRLLDLRLKEIANR